MKICKTAGIVICLVCVPAIQGCLGVAATGAAVGGVAAQDRRTPGNYIDDELTELKVLAAIRWGRSHGEPDSHQRDELQRSGAVDGRSTRRVAARARHRDRPQYSERPGRAERNCAQGAEHFRVAVERYPDHRQGQARTGSGRRTSTLRRSRWSPSGEASTSWGFSDRMRRIGRQRFARRVAGVQRVVKVVEYIE